MVANALRNIVVVGGSFVGRVSHIMNPTGLEHYLTPHKGNGPGARENHPSNSQSTQEADLSPAA
jgi:hypothetical protein